MEKVTLGGGCFWCLEAIFNQLKGIENLISGYSGGKANEANYKAVCSGKTKHIEVVHFLFNAKIISYEEILEVFFASHDPTSLNKQGNDVGYQYRSIIFYHHQTQKEIALHFKKKLLANKYSQTIITEIKPFTDFYPAEDYHQQYYKRNNSQPYCLITIKPKLKKIKSLFQNKVTL